MAPKTLEETLADLAALRVQMEKDFPGRMEDDPLRAIARAFEARAWAEKALADRIAEGRDAGLSWAAIGSMIGTTGEAARQRYGR